MSLLAGINLVLGLASAASQNRAASNAARIAQKEHDDAINSARQDDEQRMKWYRDAVASGQFNPAEAERLAEETATHELRNQVGNYQGDLLSKGYEPGSSNLEQGSRTLSQNARLRLAGMKQGIRTDTQTRQMGAMNFAAPRANSMILNQSNVDRNRSDNMGSNPMGLLSSVMSSPGNVFDFLKKRTSDPEFGTYPSR